MNTKNIKRGFAALGPEALRAIASKGGTSAHARGHAHEFDTEEARKAGAKGGKVTASNREHMAQIGRKGGLARSRGKPRAATTASDSKSA